jgi:hypothetical protein
MREPETAMVRVRSWTGITERANKAARREFAAEMAEDVDRLKLRAPRWRDKQRVREFVRLRPLRLIPLMQVPVRTGRRGRPREGAYRSAMPAAERAFVEITWFLTKCYYPTIRKPAIRRRALEFAAAEFGTSELKMGDYWRRHASERQRLWPKPSIDLP